jgi:hypothetical protein
MVCADTLAPQQTIAIAAAHIFDITCSWIMMTSQSLLVRRMCVGFLTKFR